MKDELKRILLHEQEKARMAAQKVGGNDPLSNYWKGYEDLAKEALRKIDGLKEVAGKVEKKAEKTEGNGGAEAVATGAPESKKGGKRK